MPHDMPAESRHSEANVELAPPFGTRGPAVQRGSVTEAQRKRCGMSRYQTVVGVDADWPGAAVAKRMRDIRDGEITRESTKGDNCPLSSSLCRFSASRV